MLNLFFHVFKKVKREATKVNSVVNFNSPNTFSWLSMLLKLTGSSEYQGFKQR